MNPKGGGRPLPESPICLGAAQHSYEHGVAREYAKKIREALDDHGAAWSASQKQCLRSLLAKWTLRAMGGDSYFEKFGTFRRPPNGTPPNEMDREIEKMIRRVKAAGEYVSNREHWERTHLSEKKKHMNKVEKEMRRRYGTKTEDHPKKDD